MGCLWRGRGEGRGEAETWEGRMGGEGWEEGTGEMGRAQGGGNLRHQSTNIVHYIADQLVRVCLISRGKAGDLSRDGGFGREKLRVEIGFCGEDRVEHAQEARELGENEGGLSGDIVDAVGLCSGGEALDKGLDVWLVEKVVVVVEDYI